MNAVRVLLVEDSATDAKLVVETLRAAGFSLEFERVETEAKLRTALAEREWDAVISDWSLPGFGALAALRIVKELGSDLPFVIVSGTIGEEAAADAMRAGAHDCVLKDNLARLPPALDREIRESRDRAAHRRSELRTRAMLESAIEAIIGMDASGCITEFNPAAERKFRYARADVLGRPLADVLIPERSRDDHRRGLARYLGTGERSILDRRVEVTALRGDGSEFPIELAVTRVGTESPPSFMGFVRDLSERKRSETALQKSEEQLRQALKMEAVGRLAGGIAHDFNNLLSVILGYAEVMLEDLRPPDPVRKDVEIIRQAATRAASLTRQLLMFSRQHVVESRVIDLNEVVGNLEHMLRRILGEDIELRNVAETSSARVRADVNHLEQVIMNLVVNARDAMPTGGKLTIEVAEVTLDADYVASHLAAKPGAYVLLAVTDTGVGMDKATQARIFEPFFTTKEVGKGTGLGLSTVFGIVQQSGGTIWVYSEPGHGTTFKIYLPRVEAEVEPASAKSAPSLLRGHETILVVEDEAEVRSLMLSILRRQGYRVLTAQNGREALTICEDCPERIDLLLTDVVMPQMSGPELAQRLALARADMKVLCTSGYTDDSIVRHGMIASSVAFLQKPITPTSLGKKVREVLDAPSTPSDARVSQPPKL